MILRSAGVGDLIALPGAIGYILVGLGRSDLPPGSHGFISIFAFCPDHSNIAYYNSVWGRPCASTATTVA